MKAALVMHAILALIVLGINAAIIYAIVHFVVKFW